MKKLILLLILILGLSVPQVHAGDEASESKAEAKKLRSKLEDSIHDPGHPLFRIDGLVKEIASYAREECLYVADHGNHRVRKVGIDGTITTFAGTGVIGFSGDGGPAEQAQLNYPMSVAVDSAGNVYIADKYNHRIRQVGVDGKITTLAGTGVKGFSGDGGPADQAQLNYPGGVAVDYIGNVCIADEFNHRIRKIGIDGTITTLAGTGVNGFSGDGGLADQAQLNYPMGVAVDGAGNVYISDEFNNRIRQVGVDGKMTTLAGTGVRGFSGDGGLADQAQLNHPRGLAVDSAGNVYITDWDNDRIRKVGIGGRMTTLAGTGVKGFSGEGGPADQAQLNYPVGLAVDSAGNVYIADYYNHRIRKLRTDGKMTTLAGTGVNGFSGDGGPANHAQLNYPAGVAIGLCE